jgi:hypothetical protein
MKSSRNGSAGVDRISDSEAGREKTIFNMEISFTASVIDAVAKSINYYAEMLEPFVAGILLTSKALRSFSCVDSAKQFPPLKAIYAARRINGSTAPATRSMTRSASCAASGGAMPVRRHR